MDNAERIWVWFKQNTKLPDEAIAGILGNIHAESACLPTNLENTGNMKLGISDDQYTAIVDNGNYSKASFVNDNYGYGLFQTTYPSRKEGLYNYCKSKGVSIGDLEAQLEYAVTEAEYKGIESTLLSCKDIGKAADIFCRKFEIPFEITNNVKTRTYYGTDFYNEFHGKNITAETATDSTAKVTALQNRITALTAIRNSIDTLIAECETELKGL